MSDIRRTPSGIVTTTESGVEIEADYAPADGVDPRVGAPGEFPYTRGIHREMYRQRLWTMRQYSGFGDPALSNQRYRALIEAGQTGLSVAFDLPTQLGYDSDDPLATPEVGRVGVAIDTLQDLDDLFDQVPLDHANPSFTINAPAPVLAAMYVALARRRGTDLSKLRATLQNDILKEFLTRGAYVFPPGPSVKLAIDVIEYCNEVTPSVYPISVCGSHIRDTGATGLDALAITLADALAYLRGTVDRGLNAAAVASRFSFLFCARQDPLVEAASIRAARRLWAYTLRDQLGIDDPAALKFRLFNSSSNQMFTRHEPLNNIVRGTLAGLGVILGGAQAATVIGYDEAYDIPSEEAQRVGLRTQQILAYETHIPATVDPLAGSYYVEALTDESEQRLAAFLAKIDERGGVVKAIEDGWIQELMYDRAYELEKGIANGDVSVVGVNTFATGGATDADLYTLDGALHQVDETVVARQVDRLERHRAKRDGAATRRAVDDIRRAAQDDRNVCPAIEVAVTAGATVGECMSALRDAYGVYHEGGKI
ncbi:methylmalonyl-CoA mutase [Actinophytocola sp.]|uniref:acyl-CoA mutase large subunit family protein n=1 Tax=Actinophytocola sp. TaxID=1872138 RepID=UPI0025B80CCE|nr:methylmalonyl-CoA mutase family protein [Actinophytocola sp.]